VPDEFALYVIHGLLHLLGYHDHPPGERRRMERREETLLQNWKRSGRWSLIRS
jgi:ssRNA-specific RNase YbeY (16S rRNA maturation enzyme)